MENSGRNNDKEKNNKGYDSLIDVEELKYKRWLKINNPFLQRFFKIGEGYSILINWSDLFLQKIRSYVDAKIKPLNELENELKRQENDIDFLFTTIRKLQGKVTYLEEREKVRDCD